MLKVYLTFFYHCKIVLPTNSGDVFFSFFLKNMVSCGNKPTGPPSSPSPPSMLGYHAEGHPTARAYRHGSAPVSGCGGARVACAKLRQSEASCVGDTHNNALLLCPGPPHSYPAMLEPELPVATSIKVTLLPGLCAIAVTIGSIRDVATSPGP